MKNIRKGAWQSKRGPTPAIPAYKRPRQRKTTETDNIPFSELKEKRKQDKTNTIVLITETEPETEARVTEEAVTNTVLERVKVAKHFEAGLFIGEITAVNTLRGRSLYTVLYEDGET